MDRRTEIADHFIHVGGGTGLVLGYLGLIPGFLPFVALTVLVGVVLVAPFVIAGLALALLAAPIYLASRVVRRARRRRRRNERRPTVRPQPIPTPHTS